MLLSTKVQDLSLLVSSPSFMEHIVVGCFRDLQAQFECIKHKQEKMFFNINVNEVIHNWLYNKNKNNNSLIIVQIYGFDNFKLLKSKINPIEYLTTLIPNCIWNHILYRKS